MFTATFFVALDLQLSLVHTTPEKFENESFNLKTHQMFSVHTTPEKFENATITGRFEFVFEENSGRQITWLSWRHRFRKALFPKCFSSTPNRKAGVSKFLWFEERFRKAPFSWRISVDGWPNSIFNFLKRSVHWALWNDSLASVHHIFIYISLNCPLFSCYVLTIWCDLFHLVRKLSAVHLIIQELLLP